MKQSIVIFLCILALFTACSNGVKKEEPKIIEISFFDKNSLISKISIETGGKTAIPTPPPKAGYSFEGWSQQGGDKILLPNQSEITFNEPASYYACWCDEDIKSKLVVDNGAITCTDKAIRNIEIPEILDGWRITAIGDEAFKDNAFLESIFLPESIESIRTDAFYGCESLKEINLPSSIENIGMAAFANCKSLSSITLPDNLKMIGSGAFIDCSSLEDINIPDSVEYMDPQTFYWCTSLTSVKIGSGIKHLPDQAFAWAPISSITIPGNVEEIELQAFMYCSELNNINLEKGIKVIGPEAFWDTKSLKHITLPDSVTTIENRAFIGSGIETIDLPNSLTYIGEEAFRNTKLKTITIPASVSGIEKNAFMDCAALVEINVAEDNLYYSSVDGVLYDKAGEILICYPEGKTTSE